MRSLALAALSVGTGIGGVQAQNVTAFNPYNGVGLPVGAVPSPGMPSPSARAASSRGYPVVDAMPAPPAGMAFNPWSAKVGTGAVAAKTSSAVVARRPNVVAIDSSNVSAAGTPNVVASYSPAPLPSDAPAHGAAYGRGSILPPPPPGAIRSRIIAIPERGDGAAATRSAAPSRPPVAVAVAAASPAPVAAPVPAARTGPTSPVPAPTSLPQAAALPPAAPAPSPNRTVISPPSVPAPKAAANLPAPPAGPAPRLEDLPPPPPPNSQPAPPVVVLPQPNPALPGGHITVSAAVPPPAAEPASRPAASAAPAVTVSFAPQSAEIDADSRNALDALARSLAQRGVKRVELRAYSTGDPADARKVALARALSVRSYLIDRGVKTHIEVGGFARAPRGGGGDRVDVVTP